jgi:hypothetical protein
LRLGREHCLESGCNTDLNPLVFFSHVVTPASADVLHIL